MPRSSGTKSKRQPKLSATERRELQIRAAICETQRLEHAMLVESFKKYTADLKDRYGVAPSAKIDPETGEFLDG